MTDETAESRQPPTAESPPPGPPSPPAGGGGAPPPPPPGADAGFAARYNLVRPQQGRYLAGVCAAIGRATNTDPVLWRVLLAVLGFFGGIGILIYVAAWLAIPAEGDSASPLESMLGRGRSSMSPVTVIILGVLVAVMFAFIVADQFRAILLGAAVIIGGALLLNRNNSAAANPPGSGADPANPPGPAGPTGGGWPPPGPTPPTGDPAPTAAGVPFGAPAQSGHPGSIPRPDPGPPGPWSATGPVPPAPAGSSATPPHRATPSGGYRPPFAPRGPYVPAGPYPPTPPPARPKPSRERSPLGGATFSMIFVALGVVAILDLSNAVPIGPSAYFAAALVTIALGLLVGAWIGRARWLIALGLAFTVALGIATLAESDHRERSVGGSAIWRPGSYELMADHYENRFGDATLDLRAVDFTNRTAAVSVQVDFGQLRVIVPPDVDVTALTDVNAGSARVFDERWSGVRGPMHEVRDLGGDGVGGGTLRLYLHVNAGDVEVTR